MKKSQIFLLAILGFFALGALGSHNYSFFSLCLLGILAIILPRIIRFILMKRYFASVEFLEKKNEIQSIIKEHNEVSAYVDEIRQNGKFEIGQSATGHNASLAQYINTSKHDYKRDRNVPNYSANNVYNASLQIVRKAAEDPIKYLIKYFEIGHTEEKLSEIESLGESISKLENAVANLGEREQSIAATLNPPKFILRYYLEKFRSQVGLEVPPLFIPYPKYLFQYVSAGGNSSQETRIELNSNTIDVLIQTISEKIKFQKSAAGQRALMTNALRKFIKERDNYACQICEISIRDEAHLLLEIDHIQPVSKGGLTIETNLQTLCWKCNRTKSNK